MYVSLTKDVEGYGKKGEVRHLTDPEAEALMEQGAAKRLNRRDVLDDGSAPITLRKPDSAPAPVEDRRIASPPRAGSGRG